MKHTVILLFWMSIYSSKTGYGALGKISRNLMYVDINYLFLCF